MNLSPTWSRAGEERTVTKHERQRAFLAALRAERDVEAARVRCNIPKPTLSNWRVRNPVFALEMDDALEGK